MPELADPQVPLGRPISGHPVPARCGRPTATGRPCERILSWYEDACTAHATTAELSEALRRLRGSSAILVDTIGVHDPAVGPFNPPPTTTGAI